MKLEASDLKEGNKDIQKKSFTSEYRTLLPGEKVIYNRQLKLFINEDRFACCNGHLDTADICPYLGRILPIKHRYTELSVKERVMDRHLLVKPLILLALCM